MATAKFASFVGRTKAIDTTQNAYGEVVQAVGASTTFEATGSNISTAFIVNAGSGYTLTPVNGSGTISAGLVTGQLYPIALKKVVNTGGTTVTLLR
jgi:hypothetical protein